MSHRNLKTRGFFIHSKGKQNLGISDETWSINGDFLFFFGNGFRSF